MGVRSRGRLRIERLRGAAAEGRIVESGSLSALPPLEQGTLFNHMQLRKVGGGSFPDIFIPPHHYPSPVSGRAWTQENQA